MTLRCIDARPDKPIMWTFLGKPYVFAPTSDVPDDYAEMLLKAEGYKDKFERVAGTQSAAPQTHLLECPVCHKVCRTLAGLGSHKRKHKESREKQ